MDLGWWVSEWINFNRMLPNNFRKLWIFFTDPFLLKSVEIIVSAAIKPGECCVYQSFGILNSTVFVLLCVSIIRYTKQYCIRFVVCINHSIY